MIVYCSTMNHRMDPELKPHSSGLKFRALDTKLCNFSADHQNIIYILK